LLRRELDFSLSPAELFVIDSLFSTFFLYIFAFVVIHSLTKSFQLQNQRDPLYDIFHHSEYFHLWLTHIVFFVGTILLASFFGIINSLVPLDFQTNKFVFHIISASGIMGGGAFFIALWLADPQQKGANFMRLMKLVVAFFFLVQVFAYFIINPAYDSAHFVYWWSLFAFATVVTMSAFSYKSVKARSLLERLVDKFQASTKVKNIQLFKDLKGRK
jgi:hypothetical protein